MIYELRDYQKDCLAEHWEFFAKNPDGHPLFVAPTASGKSIIIAEFVRRSIEAWPQTRVVVLTHVKELIRQNHEKFTAQAPEISAGVYSAGLSRRDTECSVLFAGIQSVYKRAQELGHFDLVLIDEAHLVPKKGLGRYRHYLEALRAINPGVRVLGYTATHYRLDGGWLHKGEGRIFTHVAYEIEIERLVVEGWLAPLVAKKPRQGLIDTSRVHTDRGDFKKGELESAARAGGCVRAAISEVVQYGREQARRAWLIFACGVQHAEDICVELFRHNVPHAKVFGHTKRVERDEIIENFKLGNIQALVNVGVLTTGFDAPIVDLMAVLRPTKSAGLYVQMYGRGMRIAPGKSNCLVLDYGENVERHGPITHVRPRKKGEPGPALFKVCPECQSYVAIAKETCPDCGFVFPKKREPIRGVHDRKASLADPMRWSNWHRVDEVWYRRHVKEGRPDSMCVEYRCGLRTFREWVCLDHGGYASTKAVQWWRFRDLDGDVPEDIDEALERACELDEPREIQVDEKGEYPEIVGYRWKQGAERSE